MLFVSVLSFEKVDVIVVVVELDRFFRGLEVLVEF